jgi:hypothetical protein
LGNWNSKKTHLLQTRKVAFFPNLLISIAIRFLKLAKRETIRKGMRRIYNRTVLDNPTT